MGTLYIDDTLVSTKELLTRIIDVAPELKKIGYIIKAEARTGPSELKTRTKEYKGNKNIIKHLNNIIAIAEETKKPPPVSTARTRALDREEKFRRRLPEVESFSANDDDDDRERTPQRGYVRETPYNAGPSPASSRRAEPPRRTQQQQAGPKKGDLDNDEMESFLNDNFGTGSTGGSGLDD